MQVHTFEANGLFVAHDRFVVDYAGITDKKSNKRMQLSEGGVYIVKNGKIAREGFLPHVGS